MTPEEESQIAAGLRAGDPEAWRSLYEAHFDSVWALVVRVLGDRPAAMDVLQETFCAAASSARRFDPKRGSIWNWLSGIARNQIALHFRREWRNGRIRPGGDLFEPVARHLTRFLDDGHTVILESEEADQRAGCVRAALAGMKGSYRDLLIARYVAELSVEAIAQSEGRSVEAIRSRLARARDRFKSLLKSMGESP